MRNDARTYQLNGLGAVASQRVHAEIVQTGRGDEVQYLEARVDAQGEVVGNRAERRMARAILKRRRKGV